MSMNYEEILTLLNKSTVHPDGLLLSDYRFLLSVFDSSQDGILIADDHANVLYINRAYEETTGLTKEIIVGKNLKTLLDLKMFNCAASLFVLEQKQPITLSHKYITGKEALTTANPVRNKEGDIVAVLSNTRNVDELVKLRSQVRANKILEMKYTNELAHWRKKQMHQEGIIASGDSMRAVLAKAQQVAPYDTTVLITGETGTGKEVIAKYLHSQSKRKDEPFIQINCAAVPSELFESELFGYEAGAFTGASQKGKLGILELANGGTLLLDEISELPFSMQTKLLRALQEQEFRRVGGSSPVKVDIRILSATNKDLAEEVAQGRFRRDLYFRLNVLPLHIPPLRERENDVTELIDYFLGALNQKYKRLVTMDEGARSALEHYSFPGNVRELQNLVEYLFITADPDTIYYENLPPKVINEYVEKSFSDQKSSLSLESMLGVFEKQIIISALKKNNSMRQAALDLKIHPSTLSRKLKSLNIDPNLY